MMFSLPTISVSIQMNHPQSSLSLLSERRFHSSPCSMVVHAGRSILNSRLPSVMQCITSCRIYAWSLCSFSIGSFQFSLPTGGVVGSRSRMSFLIVLYKRRGMGGSGLSPNGVRARRIIADQKSAARTKTAADCDVAETAVASVILYW